MKKFKYLPIVVMLILSFSVLMVGVYALQVTRNSLEGTVIVGTHNPEVRLTAYYVPDNLTPEQAILNNANIIGGTRPARYGIKFDISDERLNFKMKNVNEFSDLKTKRIAIKIENTSNEELGAYFTDNESSEEVKKEISLATYTSRTVFDEGALVPDCAKAELSKYTQIPARKGNVDGQAIVTIEVSLLKLSPKEIFIKLDTYLIIENFDEEKLINFNTDPHIAINATEDGGDVCTPLTQTLSEVSQEFNMIQDGVNIGAIPMRVFSTSTESPSFNFKAIYQGEEIGAEYFEDNGFEIVLVRGNYISYKELMMTSLFNQEVLEEGMLIPEQHYEFNGAEIILYNTCITSEHFDFTLFYIVEEEVPVYIGGGNGENSFALLSTPELFYEEYVELNSNKSFTYTFVEESEEIAKDTEENELAGVYVNISKIALKNVPITESINGAIITTSMPYRKVLLVADDLYRGAVNGEGTLSSLIKILETGAGNELLEEGEVYSSYGSKIANGTEFVISGEYVGGSNTRLVLIMLATEDELNEDLTKQVSLNLSLITETNPLIYTFVNEDGGYYSVTGSYMNNIAEVKIPATYKGVEVKAIGEGAFSNTDITTLDLSEATNLTTIGDRAFEFTDITTLDLSKLTNLKEINTSAFSGCTNLAKVILPKGLNSIGISAFNGCKKLMQISIPNSVASIGNLAFASCKFTSLNIPNGVTSIGRNAFDSCVNLYDITLPNGLTSIEMGVFKNCDSLEVVTIPNGVTSIGQEAFYGCDALKFVGIPNSVMNIGASAFAYCDNLNSISIPGSVTTIGNSAFRDCTGLTSLTIPNSVTTIGYSAFENCNSLTEINFDANLTNVPLNNPSSSPRIFANAGKEGSKVTLNIGPNVTAIQGKLFTGDYNGYNNSNITEVNFEDGSTCTTIGDCAFWFSLIEKITIPENVTIIGDQAFYNCTGLTEINYNAIEANLGVEYSVFGGGNTERCETVNIGPKVKSIPNEIFQRSYITTVNFAAEGVCESIGDWAFAYCYNLISITIPDSVTSIGGSAFNGCESLTNIIIPDNVTSIGDYAFYGLPETAYTTLNGIKYIKSKTNNYFAAVGYTEQIPANAEIHNLCKFIVGGAFCYCASLIGITIPDSVTSIGYSVFSGCTGLTNITIPDSVTSIGEGAFADCYNLKEIIVEAHAGATEASNYIATLPTIDGYSWYVYQGNSTTGTKVSTDYIQYSNVKYKYKAIANS